MRRARVAVRSQEREEGEGERRGPRPAAGRGPLCGRDARAGPLAPRAGARWGAWARGRGQRGVTLRTERAAAAPLDSRGAPRPAACAAGGPEPDAAPVSGGARERRGPCPEPGGLRGCDGPSGALVSRPRGEGAPAGLARPEPEQGLRPARRPERRAAGADSGLGKRRPGNGPCRWAGPGERQRRRLFLGRGPPGCALFPRPRSLPSACSLGGRAAAQAGGGPAGPQQW